MYALLLNITYYVNRTEQITKMRHLVYKTYIHDAVLFNLVENNRIIINLIYYKSDSKN